jgi:hypothetical protein
VFARSPTADEVAEARADQRDAWARLAIPGLGASQRCYAVLDPAVLVHRIHATLRAALNGEIRAG